MLYDSTQSKFGYDYRKLPVTDTLNNGRILNFTYDANGQRIKYIRKNTSDSSRIYILGTNGKIVAEYKTVGNVWRVDHYNIYGSDLIGKLDSASNTRYYYLSDWLGSTRVVMNQSGSVDSWTDYYPFGKEARGSSTVNEPKEGFTGYLYDAEMDYNYAGARYYNSEIGKWISVDKYQKKYPEHTPYHYVFNNPLRYTDPTGDTVKVDQALLDPVLYQEGENKGKEKKISDMSPSELQRYNFQQWWKKEGSKIEGNFGIGGKYEKTNVSFKLGVPERGFWSELFGKDNFYGQTIWGQQGMDESDFSRGGKAISPSFGIDQLDTRIYFHPEYARPEGTTPSHEWKHFRIIFDAVKNNKVVPTGAQQHDVINKNLVPEIK